MPNNRIDWCQVWYPGPKRAFTADEMARAGSDEPSRTMVVVAGINFACVAFAMLQMAPASQTARLTAALAALAVMGSATARWLWWRPWRRPLLTVSLGLAVAMALLSLGVRWVVPDREDRYAVALTLSVGCALLVVVFWFMVMWRSQQIESRLREMAERERAIEMARRLAAAQLEPHFLFNTLASLQHWVHTKDERAATLLDALTGYLRATLPMFNRALQPVGDELEAVRRYLDVMHARFGERLRFVIGVPVALHALPLPPGLLLTLVENAVEHGIEPRVAGGELSVRGRRDGDEVLIEIIDDGPGPALGAVDGIGLANNRERLALAYGGRASLHIAPGPQGGCVATVRVRWSAP